MLAAALVGLAAAWWRPFRVEIAGDSMRPTLQPGDWALAVARARIREGAVVLLERPDRPGLEVVKRIAAEEPGGLVVLGDNPQGSTDSRHFGPVSRDVILGRLRLVYWPPRRWRLL